MTTDRLIHLLVGIIFLFVFLKVSNITVTARILLIGGFSTALGTWVSDWDLILGIGYHRSPLTHSILPALILGWLAYRVKLDALLMIGFCLGLSSHLFWDTIDYGNVQWITGGDSDRLFLSINCIILLVFAFVLKSKYLKSNSRY